MLKLIRFKQNFQQFGQNECIDIKFNTFILSNIYNIVQVVLQVIIVAERLKRSG